MSGGRQSSYRWVLHAYPAEYREAVGPELVDTASQLSGGRWSLRQSGGLLAGGLRTRERVNNGGDWPLSAAQGMALALVVNFLAGGLALGLFAAGVEPANGTTLVGVIPVWVSALLALAVAALLVRSTLRPPLVLVAVLLLGSEVASTISAPEYFSVSGLSSIAWPLLSLWVIDRFGDGRGVLSVPSIAVISIGLVAFALGFGDPSLTVIAMPVLIVVGLFMIRLRPTWAFAALTLAARGFIVPDLSPVELAGSIAAAVVVALVGFVAVRSVRRLSDV